MAARVPATALIAMATLVLGGSRVYGAQYPGWGDTGWVHASKRECCNAAIDIAAQYSADACAQSGGVPRAFAGASQRGTCNADWMQDDDGSVLYRCYGEAAVWCR